MTNEGGETESRGEGEINHYVISATGGDAGEDKVEGDGDEDARRTKNHQEIITCLASYWSIPPYAELEALELIVNVGEATCIRCPSRQ
ncbi:hypothetical protein BHM03_00052531 [Ensete ventricosum]|nr:hypothetical protein BHM03_00052531 [Ensete ventricosum]